MEPEDSVCIHLSDHRVWLERWIGSPALREGRCERCGSELRLSVRSLAECLDPWKYDPSELMRHMAFHGLVDCDPGDVGKCNALITFECMDSGCYWKGKAVGLLEGDTIFVRSSGARRAAQEREEASKRLASLSSEESLDVLVSALSDSREVSDAAERRIHHLGLVGSIRAQDLLSALEHDNPVVRRFIARLLGELKIEGATEGLVRRVSDSDEGVRRCAIDALERNLPPEEYLRLLTNALSESKGLAMMVEPKLVTLARTCAAELVASLRDQAPAVRASAAKALGLVRERGAVESLIEALSDHDKDVRQCAATALGSIGDERAVPALSRCAGFWNLRGGHKVKTAARDALARIYSKS